MKKLLSSLMGLAACLLVCANVFATDAGELRVLLRFDDTGHHVEQVIRPRQSLSLANPDETSPVTGTVPDLEELRTSVQPGMSSLVWLDEQGDVIRVSTAPDPRVSHSPSHIEGANESRALNESGAWLVNGPGEAKSLLILLPANLSPALASEQWEVGL